MVSKILKNFVIILFLVIGFTLISESMANAGDTCNRNADTKIILDALQAQQFLMIVVALMIKIIVMKNH